MPAAPISAPEPRTGDAVPDRTPVTTERARPRPRRLGAATVAGAFIATLVLVAAACSSTGVVETGGAAGSDPGRPAGTTAPTTAAPEQAPADVVDPAPPAGGGAPTTGTTCVDAPATTTPWDQGGGRIVCSGGDPDGSVSSPPNSNTTIPAPSTSLVPDGETGVLVVNAVGGYDCPDGQACVALGIIMSGTIVIEAVDGTQETAPLDSMGRAGFRLLPGTHRITAQVPAGSCTGSAATIVAGEATEVALTCTVPLP